MTTVLVILLAVVLFFLAFILLRTARFSASGQVVDDTPALEVDGRVVAEHLSQAVQVATISHMEASALDPAAFRAMHALLKRLYPGVHHRLELEIVSDYSLLFTWRGRNPELEPVLLANHFDVVPAEDATLSEWTHPPFSGLIADGFVWGRGTQDNKCGVIAVLEAVERLLNEGFAPERTLYLGFGHDEEVGGRFGAGKIAAALRARGVTLACVLDEGGRIATGVLPGVKAPVGLVGIAEKGYLLLEMTAQGSGGHSAMPQRPTAIGRLSRAIERLENAPFPYRLDYLENTLRSVGSELPFSLQLAFANRWLFGRQIRKQVAADALIESVARTTVSPTVVVAGVKDNVLPRQAKAVVNLRLMPGGSVRAACERVKDVIDDPQVSFTPLSDGQVTAAWEASPVTDTGSPFYQLVERLVARVCPGSVVAPVLLMALTDSRYYASLTSCVMRFSPLLVDKSDIAREHNVDERISIENCARAVAFYYDFIRMVGMGGLR
jgi:carboxypeptidase PM20D1